MGNPAYRPDQLDFEFGSECPRCGHEAGWTGRYGSWEGHRTFILYCCSCSYEFDFFSGRWEKDYPLFPPRFVPGRNVPGTC